MQPGVLPRSQSRGSTLLRESLSSSASHFIYPTRLIPRMPNTVCDETGKMLLDSDHLTRQRRSAGRDTDGSALDRLDQICGCFHVWYGRICTPCIATRITSVWICLNHVVAHEAKKITSRTAVEALQASQCTQDMANMQGHS